MFFLRAFEMLEIQGVSVDHLSPFFEGQLEAIIGDDERLKQRLKNESLYFFQAEEEKQRIAAVKKQESVRLSDSIDYFDPRLNLSNEVRELLANYRPSSVSLSNSQKS